MRIINNKQTKSSQSIFLCREVDLEHLGREVYADHVETPYSFYLIRKLNLARDYQNLAEGEAFFDAICDSWDETNEFEGLVVKKIYMYVETEIMFYTILFGSFEPVVRNQKVKLKEWLAGVALEKVDRSLVHNGALATNNDELKSMMQQLMETSNEIFRLRKVINSLNDNMSVAKIEAGTEGNPVISRSIRTIHLKRAQPLLVEEEENGQEKAAVSTNQLKQKHFVEPAKVVEVITEAIEETDELLAVEPENAVVGKKLNLEVIAKQKSLLKEPSKLKNVGILDSDQKKGLEKIRPLEVNLNKKTEGTGKSQESDFFVPTKKRKPLMKISSLKIVPLTDFKRLVFTKGNAKKETPENWSYFSRKLIGSKTVMAPKEKNGFSKTDLEKLEDKIYFRFMNKRVRGASNKSHSQKKSISRQQLLAQIGQAEYLNYSWGQVLKERKEDILICGRLSSANLVGTLDEFLQEMREIAYSRSLFGQKVRCSVDRLRRLEGYILMDRYMQKLSLAPIDFGERKGYF